MNKTFSIIIAIIVVVIIGVILMLKGSSVNKTQSGQAVSLYNKIEIPDGATAIKDGTYNIPANTFVSWAGNKKVLENWVDKGTVSLKSGMVLVSAGIPVAGNFDIDMTTISSSKTGKGQGATDTGALATHLKSDDFFSVDKHPTATFVLTQVRPTADVQSPFKYSVTGRLFIKGIQQEVTFDAHIYDMMGKLAIQGAVDVDRTLWDIRFGSEKFFSNLGDKAINDIFVINLNLETIKQEP